MVTRNQVGLVSTIIPVYNRYDLVVEAINSVLQQHYRPIEIIVIDDGSTDKTPQVVRSLSETHSEIIFLQQSNAGPGAAREYGRKIAQGEFIQYLDSDDILLPQKFKSQVTALQQQPEAGIAYGQSVESMIGDPRQQSQKPIRKTGEKLLTLYPELLVSRWWSTSTPLYRSSLLDLVGPWQNFLNEEDWEYDARAAALGAELAYCPELVSIRRFHSGEQLHSNGDVDQTKLAARAAARQLMLQHAVRAGQARDSREFRHFAKALFLTSRQCSMAGLSKQANALIASSQHAYSYTSLSAWKLNLFKYMTRLLGHRITALLMKQFST